MAITASFAADFTSFYGAVQKAEVSLKSFESGAGKVETSLNRMANSFSGKKVIEDANLMVAAFEQLAKEGIGLTTAELQRMGKTAAEATEKMKAMGMEVPPGLKKITDAAGAANKATTDWKGSLLNLAGAVGVGFSVGAVVNFGKAVLDVGGQIADMSQKLGISTDAVQGFKYAAEQGGTTLDAVGASLNKMNLSLAEGDKSTVKALEDLGLRFADIRAMKPEDAFLAITDAVAAIPDPMEQVRLGTELMGRGFADLLPAIKAGFRETADSASKMSAETVAALEEAGDAWESLYNQVVIYSGGMIAELMKLPATAKNAAANITGSLAGAAMFLENVFKVGPARALAMAAAIEESTKAVSKSKDVHLGAAPAIRQSAEETKKHTAASGALTTQIQALVPVTREQVQVAALLATAHRGEAAELKMAEASWRAWESTVSKALGTVSKNSAPLHLVTRDLSGFTAQVDASYDGLQVHGELMGEFPPKVRAVTSSVGDLAQALAQLSLVSSGSLGDLVRHFSTIVSAVDSAKKGVSAFQQGLAGFKPGGDLLSGIMGMSTGILGIASAAIAAGKAIAGLFSSKGRDLVVDFAASFGGFDALHLELNALGAEGEKLWIALTQGVGRNNPAEAQKAIDAVTTALEAQRGEQEASTITTEAQAQATIETSAEAARALDNINERLVANQDAWGAWSATVTGYLQTVADAVRAIPTALPGGGGAGSVAAGSSLYTPAPRSGRGGGGGTAIIQLDGRTLAEVLVPAMPGVIQRYGLGRG